MSMMMELGLIETEYAQVYKFCRICKNLAQHEIEWLHNEPVLLPTQFGNRIFSFVTMRSKCLVCGSGEVKYLKIKGKIDNQNSTNQKARFLLIPQIFSKTMGPRGGQGEPHDHGEPCNEAGWYVYEKSTE